ncbi:hypothetical protein Tco_0361266 [Tanacetum coccineum]
MNYLAFKELEQEFRSSRKHFKTLSLNKSRSPNFDLFSDQEEYSEEEAVEIMTETMEQYMSKTRADYGSGVARPKIKEKDSFELKCQFLKELRSNTFSGSDHEDANEHIKKVLEIVDLFHIPNITINQVMLRAFPILERFKELCDEVSHQINGDAGKSLYDLKKAKKSVRLMMEKLVIRENRQRVLVSKRIERVGENKNRKRDVWNKNRQSDLAKTINGEVQLQALVDGKKIIITESTVIRDLQLKDTEGVDCLPNATIFEQLALMGSKTTTWSEFSSTIASAIICLATNQKFNFSKRGVHKERGDSLARAATTASSLEADGEDSLKLNELMELCTNLQQMVLDLEKTKTTQAEEIGRINGIDVDEDITLVNDQDDADMFDVNTLAGEEVFVAEQIGNVVEEVVDVIDAASTILVSAATITDVEVTLAQALAELKSAKPKADKVVIQEPELGTTTTTLTTKISVPKPPHDKGKGIMIENLCGKTSEAMRGFEQMKLDEEWVGNGYLRKGQKPCQNGQNRAREWKE